MHSPWITTQPLDLQALIDETADPSCGALVAFGGMVRNHHQGRSVRGMSYDAHVGMCAQVLQALEREVCARFKVARCRLVHRIGALELGEASVWVVVRSAHRGPAFDAAEYAIDTLKERLPVWKEEHYTDGSSAHLEGISLEPEPSASD